MRGRHGPTLEARRPPPVRVRLSRFRRLGDRRPQLVQLDASLTLRPTSVVTLRGGDLGQRSGSASRVRRRSGAGQARRTIATSQSPWRSIVDVASARARVAAARRARARASARPLADAEPQLRRFGTPQQLLVFLHAAPAEQTDAPLLALLALARRRRLAGRFAAAGDPARPEGAGRAARHPAERRDELWELLLFFAWEAICSYPVERRRAPRRRQPRPAGPARHHT